MAIVQIGRNLAQGFTHPGSMPGFNLSDWTAAEANSFGTSVALNNTLDIASQFAMQQMFLYGTGLSITPNTAPLTPAAGPVLSARIATGTISGIDLMVDLSGGGRGVNLMYQITGLSLSFQNLISSGANGLALALSGNDQINGTDFAESMSGFGGNDTFRPGMVLFEGIRISLFDTIDGGAGVDTVSFSGIALGVNVDLVAGTAIGIVNSQAAAIYANLISIENAVGGNGNDILTGNAAANTFDGGAGDDTIDGGAGSDTLRGGAGHDMIYGGLGNDVIIGGLGADVLDGGLGVDQASYADSLVALTVNLATGSASDGDTLINIENIVGTKFGDILLGSYLANQILGGAGNDQIFGLAGNDNLQGQDGNDALFGGLGSDMIIGGEGNDGLFGDAGNDTLYGGNGNDFLVGGDGNDVIWGDAGNDQIDAGAGNDFVILGAGDDVFTLGLGDDRVRFDYGNGADTIRDFSGNDVIDFTATNMVLAALQANTVETAAGVLMSLGSGSILLEGLHLSQIDWAHDFVFTL